VRVYINGDMDEKLMRMGKEEKEEEVMMFWDEVLGEDFNAGTGREEERDEGKKEEEGRRSRDSKINREERRWVECQEEGMGNIEWGR